MDIYDSNGTKLEYSAVLANLPITESCEHVEELMKADHIVLSWRDSEKYTLPVGAYITHKGVNYALLEPYEPEQKSDDEFVYTPNFQHPKMYLGKVPFRFPTTDTEGNSITLLEWPYSGDIDTLLTFFCRTMESVLGLTANTFNYSILGEIDMVVSTTFNTEDILSALTNVANKLKCEWHIDWDYKILYFGHIELSRDEVDETVLEVGVNVGTPSARSSKEGFYNTYEPQGSTRNISKRAASGEYVQGDVRLALNETDYPDKVIYTNESGTVIASLPQGVKKYVKPLIFDNIYPKLDLYVYDVRCRERDLLDDNGEKIIDHYDGSTPVYKRYAVWYMRLAYATKVAGHVTQWHDYTINPETDIISGKNLGGAFQPNTYEGAESFPLAGRGHADDGGYGFELIYHSTGETIPASGDDTGVVIKAGDYEIVFQQQNDYILPTTATQGIIPKGVKVGGQEVTDLNSLTNLDDGQKGNIVDLYNIVIDNNESAQNDLAQETLKYIANQFKDNNSYTLKSDVVAFKKRIDQDELLHTDSSLYIGEKVIYKNGDYELETRVMKLTTKLDYAFEQEIVVGNEVLKGTQTTLKEQVQTILSGGTGSGGGIDSGAVRKIVQAYTNPRFLSKIEDDTAQGFIKMLKGLQIGSQDVEEAILGEGGLFQMGADGKVHLITDSLYVRMRAYFDSVVIREYKHESGNRIVSPAQGFNASRVEYIKVVNNEETIVTTPSDADYFRCYWRVDDGEKKTENQFVIGDLAFCEHADVVNGTLVTKRYWRVVRGRNAGNTTTADGEAWIDLSNAHDGNGNPVMTTISWTGQGGTTETLSVLSFENATNGYPEAHDDISMLGCVVDNKRQGAIIEDVSGVNAPAYQIYQGLGADATNPYALDNKNQISLAYNSATGKAKMDVFGDAYIGDRSRNTYVEYKQGDALNPPQLNIRAKVQMTSSGSTIDGTPISQYQFYDDTAVVAAIGGLTSTTQSLQRQIDGAIDTWYYDYMPVAESQGAPANRVPLTNVEPYKTWYEADGGGTASEVRTERERHLDDIFYDNSTGYAFRFSLNETTQDFEWVVITDSAVLEALERASKAQATADGKMTIYSVWGAWIKNNVNTLQVGDLYIPTSNYPDTGTPTYYAKKVYKCTTDGSATFEEIAYTDDSALHSYIGQILNKTYASGDDAVAAAAQRAIQGALNGGTLVDGGLLLTSLIGMRKYNETTQQYTTWAGISGMFDAQATGNGIAAWFGGADADMEDMTEAQKTAWDALSDQDKAASADWAKTLFRFDGSGYLASNNIKWTADGKVYLANIHTSSGHEISQYFFDAFAIGIDGTTQYINPQYSFNHIDIIRRTGAGAVTLNGNSVLNRDENDARYMVTDRFKALFRVYNGNSDITDSFFTNGLPQDTSNVSIKAMFDFWSQGGITALGQGSQGGGGGAGVLYELNDVSPNASNNQVLGIVIEDGETTTGDGYVLTFNGSTKHWYAAPTAETYVLPQATTSALGGIIVSNALGSQVTLTSGAGTTANRYYGVQIDSVGQAFVNIPWTDTVYTLPAASSAALGGIMIGYNGATAKTYAVQLDTNNKAYVAVNWDDAPTDYWHTGDSRTANTVLAAPNGSNGAATFRALVAADIPNLGAGKITSGTFDAARIPDLSGTYAAVSRVSTLEGYFNASGYALYAAQLGTARSLWGNSFNGTADITSSIIISTAKSGETDKYIKIGDIYIGYDATNDAIEVYKLNSSNNHVAADFYARGGVSALGAGSSGGGGGQGDVTWDLLAANDPRQINQSHLTDALSLALYDYATQTWVQQQGYVTSSGVTSVATGTGLTGGTITSTGTISINSTYQTYISHGESAYNSLSSYLPLSGGTLSSSSNASVLNINSSAGIETGITIQRNGTTKACFGYMDGGYVYMYNATRNNYLRYLDEGALTFEGQTVIHSGNIGSQSVSYATSASNADTVDSMHASEFVYRQHSTNVYNFIGSSQYSSTGWYRVTFPHAGTTASSDYWFMLSMDVIFGGSYNGGPNGKVRLAYYFYRSAGSYTTNAGNVYAVAFGNNLSPIRICYNPNDAAYMYIYNGGQYYATVTIKNLTITDNGASYPYLNTVVEPCEAPTGIEDVSIRKVYADGAGSMTIDGSTIITSANIGSQSVSYATSAGSVAWGNIIGAPNVVAIGSDGVSEVGQYLDFHHNGSSSDYSVRLDATADSRVTVCLPTSAGTLALTSQIPTNNNQLTNGAGYITSSGSCNYATSAGSATNNVEKLAWWVDTESHNVDNLVSGVTFAYPTHNAPTAGVIASLTGTHNSYQLQLQGQYSGENLYFRNKNGNNGTWNPWRYVIHSGNIGSQSVNYATSAGNSDTLDGYHYNGLPYLPVAQVHEEQNDTNPNWVRSYAVNHRQSFVYNTSGREWAYWIGMRSSDSQYGTILRLSHDGLVQYMYKAGGADDAGWSDWKDIITQNNIGSQSVSYASSTSLMTVDNSIAYGRSGLQFAQNVGCVGTDPTIFQNPADDWYSHIIMNHSNGTGYYVDLAFCFHSDDFRFRRVSGGGSTSWGTFITSSNIGSQSVSYATSAGNSDTCDSLHVHSGRNNEANKIARTDVNGYLQCGYINSSSGDEGNNSSPARVWGTNGSDSYMRTYLTSALSVNYATSAGNADTVDSYHAADFFLTQRDYLIGTRDATYNQWNAICRIDSTGGAARSFMINFEMHHYSTVSSKTFYVTASLSGGVSITEIPSADFEPTIISIRVGSNSNYYSPVRVDFKNNSGYSGSVRYKVILLNQGYITPLTDDNVSALTYSKDYTAKNRMDIAGGAKFVSKYYYQSSPSLGYLSDCNFMIKGGVSGGNGEQPYGLYIWDEVQSGTACLQSGYDDGTASALPMSLQPLGGNVGIGTSSPSYKLDVNGIIHSSNVYSDGYGLFGGSSGVYIGATYAGGLNGYDCIERAGSGNTLYIQYYHAGSINLCNGGGNVMIGSGSPSYKLHVSGDIYATGGVTCASDARMKDVLSYQLPLTVEQVAQAPTIKFLWKDKREEGEQVGTIAQYWEKVLPQAIKSKSGELSMSYGVSALIASITTARKVVDHEKRITELEKERDAWKEAYSFIKNAYEELKHKIA